MVSFDAESPAPKRLCRPRGTLPVMRLDPGQIEVMDEAMVEIYRRMDSAQRLAVAHGMWRYARQRLEAAVRWQHPEWEAPSVSREVGRRLRNGPG